MNIREFNNLPKFLYHAGPQCAEEAIMREGLRKGFDGVVYLTTDPQHCLRFMGMRLMAHIHSVKHVEVDGKQVAFLDVVQHDYIPVFEIQRNMLVAKAMSLSTDHDPAFYGKDVVSLTYAGEIPAAAIGKVLQFAPQEG